MKMVILWLITFESHKSEIASDAYQFLFLNDQLDIAYVHEDNFLYYVDTKVEENIRISSDIFYYFDQIYYNGKEIFYIKKITSVALIITEN